METEAFSAMVSVSSMKGQEVGKYFGRERGREREERNTCMAVFMENEMDHYGGNKSMCSQC